MSPGEKVTGSYVIWLFFYCSPPRSLFQPSLPPHGFLKQPGSFFSWCFFLPSSSFSNVLLLDQGFSKYSSQAGSSSITWGLCRKANSQALLKTYWIKNSRWGPAICVSTSPLGNAVACWSCGPLPQTSTRQLLSFLQVFAQMLPSEWGPLCPPYLKLHSSLLPQHSIISCALLSFPFSVTHIIL